jgi:hypothetical protein
MHISIREYAKSVGVEVVGNLTYMGKWDLSHRWYQDEAHNAYLVDTSLGSVRIIKSKSGVDKHD